MQHGRAIHASARSPVVVRDNKVDKSVEGRSAIPTHRKRANGVAPEEGVGKGERRYARNGVRARERLAVPSRVLRGRWAWPAFAGEADDWTVRGAASSNKIQSLRPKECESPGFFPTLGTTRRRAAYPPLSTASSPRRGSAPSIRSSRPLPPFSFPLLLKGVRAAPFDGSMILLRHYRASQTPNCSAYSPYYLT